MSEHYSTPEQALIERLRRAPQPELSSEARAMIHTRILDALKHSPMPAPRPTLPRPIIIVVAVLVAAALIAGGIFFLRSQQSQTIVMPTATVTFTLAPPTETQTATATSSPTVTVTPTVVPTTSVGVISIVEGPVQKIDGNIIMIYDVPVEVDPNNPILDNILVGDVVHVEGHSQSGTAVIVAIRVVIVNVDVNVNPSSGEVWRDDGTCAHPPPDWAPANGWRRRCQGQDKNNDKDGNHHKDDDDDDDD